MHLQKKKKKQQHYLTLWGRGHTKCCPFPHVYTSTKLEIATFNGLREDTFTRNVTDGQTDGETGGRRAMDQLIFFF